MKFFGFIIWLANSELLTQFASSMFWLHSKNEYQYALVVRPHDTGIDFAPVDKIGSGQFIQYMSRNKDKKLYYLCPHQKDHSILIIEKRLHAGYGPEKQICIYEVEPSVIKYKVHLWKHPQKDFMEKYKDSMEKYNIGFTIDQKNFEISPKTEDEELRGELEELKISKSERYYFLPMISVYTYAQLKLTFAVIYDIITTDVQKKLENTIQTYISLDNFPDKIEELYDDQVSKLMDILGEQYDPQKHALELGSLVNENDFLVDRWKKTARYKMNQILIWKSNVEMWRNIQEFARTVGALINSETTITAGIGKALTITGNDDKTYEMKWGEGKDTVFIPELYWLAIKYYEKRETTGMVIIMHNEPVGGNNVEKICIKNPCIEKKIWILREEYAGLENHVYCCKLKPEVLEKLGAQFIHESFYFFKGYLNYLFPPLWREDDVKESDTINDEDSSQVLLG